MRTKTLLLTAALGAAGIATSMAQVYSVNAVGYVNKSVPLKAGASLTYALLANPLNGTNNAINTVIPTAPDGAQVFKFTNGAFENPEGYIDGVGWDPGTAVLNPGQGFFMALPATGANPTVLTFVGEVPQGTLVNPVPNGYSALASIVPQTGLISADLGMTAPPDGAQIFTWNVVNQSYDNPYGYIDGVGWDPSEPSIPVGEGFFFLNPVASFNWSRDFSVN